MATVADHWQYLYGCCMIDVTDTDAHEGDSVIISAKNSLSANFGQTKDHPYEILTSISPRVKRVYYRE